VGAAGRPGEGPVGGERSGVAHATDRVAELIGALETLPDQSAASMARELVQLVLELHGSALGTMLQAVGDSDRSGALDVLLTDEAVEGVLLLHGLHPADFETRVRGALNRLHPHLALHGVKVESLECAGEAVRIRFGLIEAGRYREDSAETIRREIEAALRAAAPDATRIDIDGLPARVSVVSVGSITVRRPATTSAHS